MFPEPALWWLDRYPEFSSHIYRHYPLVLEDDTTCVIFSLKESQSNSNADSWQVRLPELIAACSDEKGAALSILDWNTGLHSKTTFRDRPCSRHRPMSGRCPISMEASTSSWSRLPNRVTLREARRLAAYAWSTWAARCLPDGAVDALPSEDEDVTIDVQRMGKQSEVRKMPSASIIIPTHDGVEHLGLCLISLDENAPEAGSAAKVDRRRRRLGEEMQEPPGGVAGVQALSQGDSQCAQSRLRSLVQPWCACSKERHLDLPER